MEERGVPHFEVIVAGFGGQGALIVGRLLAEAGASKYEHVSYFPNYGPTIRGGESECTVILSSEKISAPTKLEPSAVILMGPATLDEFEKRVKPGGMMILDSSLMFQKPTREDLKVFYIPANKVATELGSSQIANFVLLGAYLEATKATPIELVENALEKRLGGGKREALLSLDKQALKEGARIAAEERR